MSKIVIIGNGISGITLARHIRKRSDHELLVISAESDHFYSRTALMYVYMGHMEYRHLKPYEDWFWAKNNIELLRDYVTGVDTTAQTLSTQKGQTIAYDHLVLALGSTPNFIGWPGQDLKGVQGLYSLQDLESMEAHTTGIQQACVVGGGLIGIEMAEMLRSRNIEVNLLIREMAYWNNVLPLEEANMVSRHVREHHINLLEETEITTINDNGQGRVGSVTTKSGQELPCQFLGLTIGVKPNLGFVKDSAIETERGILVNEYFETNVPNVYAIGDCAQYKKPIPGRRPIEQVWYTGRMHGETLALTLTGQKTAYQPGVWFNSAKFLDIEYQVYGTINAHPEPHEAQLYWEHKNGKKAIRIVYHKEQGHVIGFNLMGIRFRHEVCNEWLKQKAPVQQVLAKLNKANFDPEIFPVYYQGIVNVYNAQNPDNKVKAPRKSFWNAVFS